MASLTTAEAFLIFAVVESIQMFLLIYITRKNNVLWSSLMKDPEFAGDVLANALLGFMEKVSSDKKAHDVFFSFVGTCGVQMVHSAKEAFGKAGAGGKPIKTGSKLLDGIINIPGIQDIVVSTLQKKVEGGVKGAAESAVEGW